MGSQHRRRAQSCPLELWSEGTKIGHQDLLVPSPKALFFGEQDLLDHPAAAKRQAKENTDFVRNTAVELTTIQQQLQTNQPDSRTPIPTKTYATKNCPPLDLTLPPRPPPALQTEDVTAFGREPSQSQAQDEFLTVSNAGKQHLAAIDDMARRQLGFIYEPSHLGENHLRPTVLSALSIYSNAHCAVHECQFGWRNKQGKLICWDRDCACHNQKTNKQLTS